VVKKLEHKIFIIILNISSQCSPILSQHEKEIEKINTENVDAKNGKLMFSIFANDMRIFLIDSQLGIQILLCLINDSTSTLGSNILGLDKDFTGIFSYTAMYLGSNNVHMFILSPNPNTKNYMVSK